MRGYFRPLYLSRNDKLLNLTVYNMTGHRKNACAPEHAAEHPGTGIPVAGSTIDCLNSALESLRFAKIFLDNHMHALSVPLLISALEDIGTMILNDGLVFADPEGEHAKRYRSSVTPGMEKLEALALYPFFINRLLGVKPSRTRDQAFHRTVACGLRQLNIDRDDLSDLIGEDFTAIKSKAYSRMGEYPPDKISALEHFSSIDPEMADRFFNFSNRLANLLHLIIKEIMNEPSEVNEDGGIASGDTEKATAAGEDGVDAVRA